MNIPQKGRKPAAAVEHYILAMADQADHDTGRPRIVTALGGALSAAGRLVDAYQQAEQLRA